MTSLAVFNFMTSAGQMPEHGRVLKFRSRQQPALTSHSEALAAAKAYLSQPNEERNDLVAGGVFGDADVLLSLCGLLRDVVNVRPAEVSEEAARIFAWLSERRDGIGFFDERDFFLGESALLAASATRLLGNRAETELWLDRADANYRHTINPTPNLARVAYIRLTLRYDMRRHAEVLEFLPSVALSFQKLGMYAELAKAWFLEAMSLKELGRSSEAKTRFEGIVSQQEFRSEVAIRGMAMLNLGSLLSEQGELENALHSFAGALPVLEAANRPVAIADLKGMVAETLRKLGKFSAAVTAYRESVSDFVSLGMKTQAAYLRVVLAEALLELGSPREAEWELLAALPVIEEEKMMPEGIAAVRLLAESVAQRRTNPAALAKVRECIQAKN